ncbi:MAG: hypothetical protein H5T33_00970 [Candidatus Methanosuratus sp.]|nr:hypothetical protein [Candidatus Methanosuratincola sp.]
MTMSSATLYEETITWGFLILVISSVLIFAAGISFFAFVSDPNADPLSFLILLVVILIGVVVTLNFSRLSIKVTSTGITVGFGRIKTSFNWGQVEDCYLDTASALKYGGFGVRGGRHNGKNRLVYNVTRAPRLVLSVRGTKYDEFVFSTKRPEELMRIIKSMIHQQADLPW